MLFVIPCRFATSNVLEQTTRDGPFQDDSILAEGILVLFIYWCNFVVAFNVLQILYEIRIIRFPSSLSNLLIRIVQNCHDYHNIQFYLWYASSLHKGSSESAPPLRLQYHAGKGKFPKHVESSRLKPWKELLADPDSTKNQKRSTKMDKQEGSYTTIESTKTSIT